MPASRSCTPSSTRATPSQVAPALERGPCHRHRAVAVPVGLHDREQLGGRRQIAQGARRWRGSRRGRPRSTPRAPRRRTPRSCLPAHACPLSSHARRLAPCGPGYPVHGRSLACSGALGPRSVARRDTRLADTPLMRPLPRPAAYAAGPGRGRRRRGRGRRSPPTDRRWPRAPTPPPPPPRRAPIAPGQEPGDDAGEHVAAARGGERGAAGRVERHRAAGRGDDGAGALQQHDGTRPLGERARGRRCGRRPPVGPSAARTRPRAA